MANTKAATEAVMNAKDQRIAARLRGRGWVCVPPELLGASLLGRGPRADAGPCAGGCPDPAAHAEGGHDV